MNVRPYDDADHEAVAQVFTASVHELGIAEYTKEQCASWAPQPPDLGAWRKRMQSLQAIVAVEGAQVAGFISFEPNGHIEHLYVAPQYARRGVASALFGRAEAMLASAAVAELFTEASLVARPFFERVGFVVTEEQEVSVRGSSFRRFAMRKLVAAQQQVLSDVAASRRLG